jgi:hypothetical protein
MAGGICALARNKLTIAGLVCFSCFDLFDACGLADTTIAFNGYSLSLLRLLLFHTTHRVSRDQERKARNTDGLTKQIYALAFRTSSILASRIDVLRGTTRQ